MITACLIFTFNVIDCCLFPRYLICAKQNQTFFFFSLNDSQQVAFEKGSVPRLPSPLSLSGLNPLRSRKIQVLCCILRCSAIVFPKPTKLLLQLKFLVCEWKPTIRISLSMGARFVIFLKAGLTAEMNWNTIHFSGVPFPTRFGNSRFVWYLKFEAQNIGPFLFPQVILKSLWIHVKYQFIFLWHVIMETQLFPWNR